MKSLLYWGYFLRGIILFFFLLYSIHLIILYVSVTHQLLSRSHTLSSLSPIPINSPPTPTSLFFRTMTFGLILDPFNLTQGICVARDWNYALKPGKGTSRSTTEGNDFPSRKSITSISALRDGPPIVFRVWNVHSSHIQHGQIHYLNWFLRSTHFSVFPGPHLLIYSPNLFSLLVSFFISVRLTFLLSSIYNDMNEVVFSLGCVYFTYYNVS